MVWGLLAAYWQPIGSLLVPVGWMLQITTVHNFTTVQEHVWGMELGGMTWFGRGRVLCLCVPKGAGIGVATLVQ